MYLEQMTEQNSLNSLNLKEGESQKQVDIGCQIWLTPTLEPGVAEITIFKQESSTPET